MAGLDELSTMGESNMDFGRALYWLRRGEKLQRASWVDENVWIVLMPELKLPAFNDQDTKRKVNDRTAKYIGKNTPLNSRPYIASWNKDSEWQPGWIPSQADILADDWFIAV